MEVTPILMGVSIVSLILLGWIMGLTTIWLILYVKVKHGEWEIGPKLYDPGPQPTTVGDDPFEEAQKGIKTIDET